MADIATIGIRADTSHLSRGNVALDAFAREGERTEQRINRSATIMTGGMRTVANAAIGMATAFVSFQTVHAATAAARGFNAALAETSTLIDGNVAEMQRIEEGARAMARQFGGTATAQVQAYYQAISAGAGDATQATALLDAANRLAIGGVTDVTTAVDVLTTATNAYRAAGLTAAEASDALFVGMRAGKTTITELSTSVGQVLPISSALGVSFDETVAAISALTTQGISTAQATTGLRAALTSIIAPSNEAAKLAAQLGIEFSAAGVEANGFGGVMDQVMAATGGNTALIQQLFGSIEATTAALSFAGGAGEVFGDIMGQMGEKAGATAGAFDLVAGSLDERLNVVLARGGDLMLGLGNIMLAGLVPAAETAIRFVDFVGNSLETMGVIAVGLAATQIPALVGVLATKAAALLGAATAAGIMSGAMSTLGAAVAFAGGPLGLLLGILGGATAAFILFRDTSDTVAPIMDSATDAVDRINAVLATASEVALPEAARATLNLTNENIRLAQSAYAAAEAELAKAQAAASISQVQVDSEVMSGLSDEQLNRLTESRAINERSQRALAAAQADLAAAQSTLTSRINEGQLALSNAAGEMVENQRRAIELSVTMDDLAGTFGGVAGGVGGAGGVTDEIERMNEELRKSQEEIQRVQNTMQQGAGRAADFFLAIRQGSDSARNALGQLGSQLIRSGLTQWLGGMAARNPTGFLGTIFSGLGGSVVPNAKGNVVSGATIFPLSGGRTGLMGEAGPEAIVPLTRTVSGALGVQSVGGKGSGVVVNITNNAQGVEVQRGESGTMPDGRQYENFVIRAVQRGMADGAFDGALSSRTGLQPRVNRR